MSMEKRRRERGRKRAKKENPGFLLDSGGCCACAFALKIEERKENGKYMSTKEEKEKKRNRKEKKERKRERNTFELMESEKQVELAPHRRPFEQEAQEPQQGPMGLGEIEKCA